MEKVPATPQLDAARFKLAEAQRNVYQVVIEPGTTRKQILDPAFFAHVARELRPYYKLEIIADDGTLYAEAIVLTAERTWARIHITQWHPLGTKDVSLSVADAAAHEKNATPPEILHRIEYKGPHKKWCVIRNQDGGIVREKEESKANATLWLQEWLKVTA